MTKEKSYMNLSLELAHFSLLILCLPAFTGCSGLTTSQLAAVNKDWNKMIRASHIYPIYPLTQDIQPGDIYVTDTQIEDTRVWEKAGYIPFDHHVGRIPPDGYSDFYKTSFQIPTTAEPNLPRLWIKDNSWSNAPAVAFPTYSFSVKQGAGANVALPINGVPIGLGLMGAKSASGYVAIGDAHTYGVDEPSLMDQVERWVKDHQKQIRRCVNTDLKPSMARFYLQVVSRVYLTGRVTVSMVNDSSGGITLSGGAPKDVPIPDMSSTNAASNFAGILNVVNTNLANIVPGAGVTSVLPGGTLKFLAVSSRSVSMDETFSTPVVIGYTGFSWPLLLTKNDKRDATGADAYDIKASPTGPIPLNKYLSR
jgi:hypothetical protein